MRQTVLLAFLSLGLACGCGKKADTTPTTTTTQPNPDTATTEGQPAAPQSGAAVEEPPSTPVPVPTSTDSAKPDEAKPSGQPDLQQLTQQLRGWMMQQRTGLPASFEDWIAKAHVQVPPPPPGKKYAISKRAQIILQDK